MQGPQFLHERNPNLHTTPPVEHEKSRKRKKGEKSSQKPAEKISDWLGVIEKTHMGHRDDPRVLDRIKQSYYKSLVIKPENIPDSYYETQRRLARELGHGDVEITDEVRRQAEEVIVADQKSTLDNWLDYFTSEDSISFPTWAKYWAFTGMVKLSTFDKEKQVFGKRRKDTVAPFPDLNREALAYVVDAMAKKINKENVSLAEDDPEFKKLLQGANFGKLYAWAIEKVTPAEESELMITTGDWIKYNEGADHMPLVESLQGHGTGWCTAGESTAEAQLENGDFYVYYSHDKQGNPIIPRLAIRMEGENIAEVRGVAAQQNLDPHIANTDILDDKLNKFGKEGERYKSKSAAMKRLTELEAKNNASEELSMDDLRFLYEFDGKIEGFGYEKDPRICEIFSGRDMRADLSHILGIPKFQISTTKAIALSGNIKYHHGDLVLDLLSSAKVLKLPEAISGDLDLSRLASVDGLKLPESVGGYLELSSLTSAEGLKLPGSIGGDLELGSLTSAEGLKFSESIGGWLTLGSLTSAEGLKLPESIGGNLDLGSLTSVEGLKLPKSIGGVIYFSKDISVTEQDKLRQQYPNLKLLFE
ncbi:hypothetical protein HQ571_03055 [Candidatus Kuenenbacteria bacterium]|nr:hypothetical protein [Candidatus Kuenenbacteria bacterium]